MADLNGDTKQDLVVANNDIAFATVFLGNGDATFGSGRRLAILH